jgi:diguanylate cyclase (GGDEF)-like protein
MGMQDPYHVPDLSRVKRQSKMERQLLDLGLVSYVAVPLTVRERPLGSFYLGSRVAGVFGRREIGILARVAPHLARAAEQARLFWEAQARMRELSALYEVGKKLIQTLDLEELMAKVLRIVKDTFRFDHCAVLLVEREKGRLQVVAQHGYAEDSVRTFQPSLDDPGITASVARTGKTIYVPDVRNDPRYIQGVATGRSELALPLRIGEEVLGVLDIESPSLDAFPAATIRALNLFATQVALALDKARLFRAVQAQARTDGLTGLLNQKSFHDQLHKAARQSLDADEPFSLVLIDMDNLKEINDSRGHLAGNRAICAVADALREHSRAVDRTARYGGDEFALILPGAHREQAVQAADRLRRTLETMEVEGVGPMTASCGVAVFPEDSDDETMLVVWPTGRCTRRNGGGATRSPQWPTSNHRSEPFARWTPSVAPAILWGIS